MPCCVAGTMPVAYGVLLSQIDQSGRVVEFAEKPKGDKLTGMRVDTTILGVSPET